MAELSFYAKSNDNTIADDELKSFKNEIGSILGLHDDNDEIKDQIIDDLLNNGRQSLAKYEDDIKPKTYRAEMNNADSKLIVLLKKYFYRQWETQYKLSNEWFISFLTQYQNEKAPDLYERILTRTAENGNKYLKNCPILSIALQLLFENIDDECLKNTGTFDDLWLTIINEGLKSIIKYSTYIKEEVMNEQLDKNQSVLFRALREYHRPQVFSLLKEHNIPEMETMYDSTLDEVAENGWSKGKHDIEQKITSKSEPTLHSNQQQQEADQHITLVNTHSTSSLIEEATGSNKGQIQKSTTDTTIKVFFIQYGETIDVSVSSASTIEDVIKYVCQKSVRSMDIDYKNYYLFSKKNDDPFDNDKTLNETNILTIDDPDLQLKMKTGIREQIIMLAQIKVMENQDKIRVNPQTQADDIQCENIDSNNAESLLDGSEAANSNELMTNDEKAKNLNRSEHTPISKSLETKKSSASPGFRTLSLPARDVPSKDAANVLQKEDLADNYQQFQKKIQEIGEKITRDPVLRQKIAEKFNEINIVLCGSPRVGKSTLINAICQQELARTHAGLHACTNIISPFYLKGNTTVGDENINYRYNIWDTPGFENWDQAAIRTCFERIKEKPKSDILCMIYCASPGSFANLRQLEWLLEECKKQHIFCALVCTNKWSGFKDQREAVMKDFQDTLVKYHPKTREENGIIYFGNMGLCTSDK
ncbi:unnamed protein product [Adineta steineri]|uniref:G domain-containing protein n=1 Tax=Adineta steineri TaxID=433720 RepID=A0A813UU09_9BILA|nr:unnamed protein product [Adineta steineri]